jgi:hypothetical protein
MTDAMDEGQVYGTPGGDRVLVPFAFDVLGRPVEWVWVHPAAADQWDGSRWHRL